MPRKQAPYWIFRCEARLKYAFPDPVIAQVWEGLEEEHRQPWRQYCEEARRTPGTPVPLLQGEARTRLFIANRRYEYAQQDSYNPRVAAGIAIIEDSLTQDHTLEDYFEAFEFC